MTLLLDALATSKGATIPAFFDLVDQRCSRLNWAVHA
jgi:hypothetical protein